MAVSHFYSLFVNVPISSVDNGHHAMEILHPKTLIGLHGDTHPKTTFVSYIFNSLKPTLIVLSFSKKKKKITKRNRVITFKALIVQRGKGKDWSGKLNLQEPLCTQRPSQGHFLLGGLRAPFLLMEGKQNRWDTNCTFIHLKVQGNFPSTPVKFSDCLSIL